MPSFARFNSAARRGLAAVTVAIGRSARAMTQPGVVAVLLALAGALAVSSGIGELFGSGALRISAGLFAFGFAFLIVRGMNFNG